MNALYIGHSFINKPLHYVTLMVNYKKRNGGITYETENEINGRSGCC